MSAFHQVRTFAYDGRTRHVAKGDPDFDYASDSVPPCVVAVAADEPLLVYPSVAAAERHLEAEDVKNGAYPAAYGPNGEPYRVRSDGRYVVIEPTDEPDRPGELRPLLLRYLEATGRTPDADLTYSNLVATVWAIESDFGESMTHTATASAHAFRYGGALGSCVWWQPSRRLLCHTLL